MQVFEQLKVHMNIHYKGSSYFLIFPSLEPVYAAFPLKAMQYTGSNAGPVNCILWSESSYVNMQEPSAKNYNYAHNKINKNVTFVLKAIIA